MWIFLATSGWCSSRWGACSTITCWEAHQPRHPNGKCMVEPKDWQLFPRFQRKVSCYSYCPQFLVIQTYDLLMKWVELQLITYTSHRCDELFSAHSYKVVAWKEVSKYLCRVCALAKFYFITGIKRCYHCNMGTTSKESCWPAKSCFSKLCCRQEPEEDPSPSRSVCWIVLLILIVGFSVSLAYLSWNVPDVQVQQIFLRGKNLNYSIGHVYKILNESNPYEPRVSIACPCTTVTLDSWRTWIYTSSLQIWQIWMCLSMHPIFQRQLSLQLHILPHYLVSSTKILNPWEACSISRMWPMKKTLQP